MSYSEIDKLLESYLKLSDFDFIKLDHVVGSNLSSYYREDKTRIDFISFLFFDVKRGEKGVFIGFRPIMKGINFCSVKSVFEEADVISLMPQWMNDGITGAMQATCIDHPEFNVSLDFSESSRNLMSSKNEIDEEIAKKESQKFRQFFKEKVLPFYDLFPSLQIVNDKIVEQYDTFGELGKYIPGQVGFKKMAILGLCKSDQYKKIY